MNERLRRIRDLKGLSQREFSEKISIGQSTLAMLENSQRKLKDIHISQICNVFNVNEEWLRSGKGDMFIIQDSISLDDYAKKNNLSALELDIIKTYMSIDKDLRKDLISSFKSIFNKHSEVAVSLVAEDNSTYGVDDIDAEVESYRRELEAEKKGEILEVSRNGKNIG